LLISRIGDENAVKLAADANPLLAAVLGGRAALILRHPNVEAVFTTEETYAEVEEYSPVLGLEKRLDLDLVLLAVASLPVQIVERRAYEHRIADAAKLISRRDPDDVPLLALALSLDVPVWSNVKHFADAGVEWYTTENLLRRLGIIA